MEEIRQVLGETGKGVEEIRQGLRETGKGVEEIRQVLAEAARTTAENSVTIKSLAGEVIKLVEQGARNEAQSKEWLAAIFGHERRLRNLEEPPQPH